MMIDYLPLSISCGMSFAADWFFYNIGTKYTETTMNDPIARLALEQKQGEYLRERYPIFFGSKLKYKAYPSIGIGVATVPKCWGCHVKYQDHMNPTALPLIGSNDDPMLLKEPHLKDSMQWLFSEIDTYVEAGWKKGQIGLPDLQGPLNVSMKLVGDDRMLSLIARKNKTEIVDHVLEVASNTYIDIYRELRRATDRSIEGDFSISGCTYYYLSPSQWTRFVLPVVKKCEAIGKRIRLHHCGVADRVKIDAYAQYPWKEVEFGFGSDLKRAREVFIHPKLGPVMMSCRISPYRMLNQPAPQIKKDVEWITTQVKGGPVSINCVGVPWQTPEENLWALWNAVQDYNKTQEQEMDDEE